MNQSTTIQSQSGDVKTPLAAAASSSAITIDENIEKKILYRDSEEYKIIKKLPKRFPKRVNDIYITSKTDFKAQLKRCEYLLRQKINEIYLHAMGNAINRYYKFEKKKKKV